MTEVIYRVTVITSRPINLRMEEYNRGVGVAVAPMPSVMRVGTGSRMLNRGLQGTYRAEEHARSLCSVCCCTAEKRKGLWTSFTTGPRTSTTCRLHACSPANQECPRLRKAAARRSASIQSSTFLCRSYGEVQSP